MTENQQDTPILCIPGALSPEERSQSRTLRAELAAATPAIVELPNGYAFRYGVSTQVFVKAAAWIALERRCCPFLCFELRWEQGDQIGPQLTVTGPEGTRDFLAAEMPELPTNE
jgi:hypothetical protein